MRSRYRNISYDPEARLLTLIASIAATVVEDGAYLPKLMRDLKRAIIFKALREIKNKSKTARRLGIRRETLYWYLRDFGQ